MSPLRESYAAGVVMLGRCRRRAMRLSRRAAVPGLSLKLFPHLPLLLSHPPRGCSVAARLPSLPAISVTPAVRGALLPLANGRSVVERSGSRSRWY